MENQYSMRSPAVKRLMREAQELRLPSEEYYAQPLEDNLFEWHFTVRGPSETDFDNGIYHGRIILPPEYPMKPPSIILLTPNGRFEVNKKICLSISGYHPESWQPSWSIRTALIAMIGFMPTSGNGAIGSLDYTPEERQSLAKKSHAWKCAICGSLNELLLKRTKCNRSNHESLDRNTFEETNGHVFSSEAPISASSELPFSRLTASPVPIPLPDHNMSDIPHISAGVGLDNAPHAFGPKDDSTQIESPINQTPNLRSRRSEISTAEATRRNASDVANPGHNYSYYVLKLILILAIVLLALRRIFFV